jgi:cytidylate kinase
MNSQISFENCLAFLNCQVNPTARRAGTRTITRRTAITLSRQTGAGGHTIAERLASRLQTESPKASPPWTVFDRNLVEKVLEDHHLPTRLASHLPEDRTSQIEDIMGDLFEMSPPSWKLIEQTTETILRLVGLGNVIVIGRGANLVTARLPNVFHVRLVAPLDQRIASIQELRKLTRKAAATAVRDEDRGRARYLKKYFKADIEDPLLYHLVINTGFVGTDEAVEMIAEAMARKPDED